MVTEASPEGIRKAIEAIRNTDRYKDIRDRDFAKILGTNTYPLPYYSIGHLNAICKVSGLAASIEIKSPSG